MSSAALNEIEEFLQSELITWLESCLPRPEMLTGYSSLLDGQLIHSVWLQIDPEPNFHPTKIHDADANTVAYARSRNWDAIVKNIKALYEEEFLQTVLTVPDCYVLGKNPESKMGLEQMKLLLTLLLGAAVQCPNKLLFIARIKELDVDTQVGIMEIIKQVTDSQTLVLTQEFVETVPPERMIDHIVRLARERDKYHTNWIECLRSDNTNESLQVSMNTSKSNTSSNSTITSPSVSSASSSVSATENNHLAVELADLKSKMRRLRQELEEKSETLMEVKEECEHTKSQYEKLKLESQEWYSEAKRSTAYRDEVDVLREKADRVERLEIEISRYREKLSDVEFYKTRIEELREDNRTLLETKEMLEEQLLRSRKKSEQAMILESEIIKYKQKINDMVLERDVDKNKLQELIEENTQLQLATKNLIAGNETNAKQSDDEDDMMSGSGDNSLSEQLSNNAQTRALKLELENRRLQSALDNLKESAFLENSNKMLELEKDKKKLQLKCDQLQDACDRLNQQNVELENVFKNALSENKKLQDTTDLKQQQIDKATHDRELERLKISDLENQIESLNKEKQRIQNLSDSIQRRANDLEKSLEMKTKDSDQLNTKLIEFDVIRKELSELKEKFAHGERENVNLSKELTKIKQNLEIKDVALDENNEKLQKQEKELKQLNKELEVASQYVHKIQDLEKKNQELESQKKIDEETIATLQKEMVSETIADKKFKQNLEKIGIGEDELAKNELNVEFLVEKLVKNPESFKTVREIILNFSKETSSADICVLCHQKETFTVEKEIQFQREEPQLKEQLDTLQNECQTLRDTNETLQAENARRKVEVSTLNSQISSLNTQQVALQLANSQLVAEKDCLMKKLEMIKQQHDTVLQDQVTIQCLHEQLSTDYEVLNKEKEILKVTMRDIKVENRDLKEQYSTNEKIIEELKAELDTLKRGSINLGNLRAEHAKLKDDFRHLFTTNERMKHEYKNICESYKVLKSENSQLKIQNTELSGEVSSKNDHVTSMEIELTKYKQQCEMLLKMNASLDTDRRTLMDHVSQLLAQYHELLTHSLEDKQHFHTEEKMFTDKVNDLRRQKEKLEEKIMEHYKKLDNCSPKKKPLVTNIMNRMKKAAESLNRSSSKNRRLVEQDDNTPLESPENSKNESDNSNEEISETPILRASPVRQSMINRKTSEQISQVLMRGNMRGSSQSLKRDGTQSNRSSYHGYEVPPDVTATSTTSLNLGGIGSRRTVYLVEENKMDPVDSPTPPPVPQPNDTSPTTFLMFNKISTTIENDTSTPTPTPMSPTNGTSANGKDQKKKNDPKNRESSTIWWEYGCV